MDRELATTGITITSSFTVTAWTKAVFSSDAQLWLPSWCHRGPGRGRYWILEGRTTTRPQVFFFYQSALPLVILLLYISLLTIYYRNCQPKVPDEPAPASPLVQGAEGGARVLADIERRHDRVRADARGTRGKESDGWALMQLRRRTVSVSRNGPVHPVSGVFRITSGKH